MNTSKPLAYSVVATFMALALWNLSGAQPTPNDKAAMRVERKFRQYKRVHQQLLKKILTDNVDSAISELNEILDVVPRDGESHLMLAMAYCEKDDLDHAMRHANLAIQNGVPVSRLLAGQHSGLTKLWKLDEFNGAFRDDLLKPSHGPTLGNLTGSSITIWLRTHKARTVKVTAHSKGKLHTVESRDYKTTADNDFVTKVVLNNLQPQATYTYSISIDEVISQDPNWTFHTFHTPGNATRFTVAFGGGAGYVPQHERMWNTIRKTNPDLLLLLGDNVYSDDPTTHQMQRYCYYRRQSRPEYRNLTGMTPTFTIWDDHDFGTNDCQGGPEINIPAWKPDVLNVFQQNWPNPAFGTPQVPGCFYDFYIGDVHFIMLDGRYYRNLQKEDQDSSMLGPAQLDWFLKTIKESSATLKVLISPVPWVFGAKGNSRDTWNGFKTEREKIFTFLHEQKIDGVLLMSADRHRSDLWRIPRADTYDLFELNSSRLTNQHVHNTMPAAEFSYNKKQSFGHVTFDTASKTPGVTYKIISIDGETVFKHQIPLSDLQND